MNVLSQMLGGGRPQPWVSGQGYTYGAVVLSPADNMQAYVRITAMGGGAIDPSADTTNYRPYGARAIKSIQRGVSAVPSAAASVDITIAAVNVSRASVSYLGGMGLSNTGSRAEIPCLQLINSTTLRATTIYATTGNIPFGYEIVESY